MLQMNTYDKMLGSTGKYLRNTQCLIVPTGFDHLLLNSIDEQ